MIVHRRPRGQQEQVRLAKAATVEGDDAPSARRPVDDDVVEPVAVIHQRIRDAVRRRRIAGPEGLVLAILAAGERVRKMDQTPGLGHWLVDQTPRLGHRLLLRHGG